MDIGAVYDQLSYPRREVVVMNETGRRFEAFVTEDHVVTDVPEDVKSNFATLILGR